MAERSGFLKLGLKCLKAQSGRIHGNALMDNKLTMLHPYAPLPDYFSTGFSFIYFYIMSSHILLDISLWLFLAVLSDALSYFISWAAFAVQD